MNKFTKTLAASAVMALAVTGVAEARTANGQDNIPAGGELLFNLTNFTAQNTYTLDLGITIEDFLANPNLTRSISITDSNFQSFLAANLAGNQVSWGVAGSYQALDSVEDAVKFGFFTTSRDGIPSVFDGNAADINNTIGKHNGMIGSVNSTPGNGGAVSENGSSFATVGNNGYLGAFGDNFQGALPFFGQGAIGASQAFVQEGVDQTDFDTGVVNAFNNQWNFNIQGSTGTLTFGPSVAAVPLPAAVWMFGAGLMGMLRLNRRKAAAA